MLHIAMRPEILEAAEDAGIFYGGKWENGGRH